MNTTPRTETPALIMAMEHWAKTVAKNGGIAAVTIQEGADRLRELEVRAAKAEADTARLDWLQLQGVAYGTGETQEGTCWKIDGEYLFVRDAIDTAMKEEGK